MLLGVAYGLLLGVSFLVRWTRPARQTAGPFDRTVVARAVDSTNLTAGRVRIAYRDDAALVSAPSAAPVVLIHGSPGSKDNFRRLAPILARRHRVIVPDLPGFGGSDRAVPDYSFRAHAMYIRQLLDAAGIGRAHVVGFSMGGAVALSLTDLAPERVSSLTMLSAIGVQELELTGNYHINHAVHGAQLAALWIMREAIPHMGRLDDVMLGVPYARNFFDSDQRPLRNILRRVAVPALIVHGRKDDLVPIEAALEHQRLMPHSELASLDGDHFLPFSRAADVGALISAFVDRAERQLAPARADADPARVRAAMPLVAAGPSPRARGIAAAVFSGLLTAAAMLSTSVAAAAAGVLVAGGRVSLALACGACVAGGSLLHLLRHAGPWRPLALLVIADAAWASLTVAVSALLAFALFSTAPPAMLSPSAIAVGTVACVAPALVLMRRAATARGRRLVVSSWRRFTRWEFWPPWVFYPPLLAYIACLMVKHRSATLFTSANPAIVAGGFVGESKYAILQGLGGAAPYVARSRLIAGDLHPADKTREARRFIAEEALAFPIVLKPDHGQRGSGVVVVRSFDALEDGLARSSVDTIIQEHVGGAEFGVFYHRRPSESRGHIFSVTEKRFPTVVGDGRRTLEQLILQDDRAVCSARLHCERHHDTLSTVPAEGESIPLVELGTHCRGAMFLDGGWVLTPALEDRFDAIARGFDGFYFGRFDVRLEGGIDAFREGRGFKIIELNGVTSEATHIYHPGTPLTTGYRVLMRQWRLAFEIGAENRCRGVAPALVRRLIELAREYRRTARRHL